LARLGSVSDLWRRYFPNSDDAEIYAPAEGALLRSMPFLGEGDTDPLINNDSRGDLLSLIRGRGVLQVAIGGTSGNLGFSSPDGKGSYKGVDVDLARAIAIAILGDATKLEFNTRLPFASTFAAVANGTVDLALGAATVNIWRDGAFGVKFSDPYLLTGLRILAHASLGITRPDQLNGSSIGVISGTNGNENLSLALAATGGAARIVEYSNADALYNAFARGEVDAIARNGAFLATFQEQLKTQENPVSTVMLAGRNSYDPIAAVVDENQSKLLDLVNGVIAILKHAALLGVTSANVSRTFEKVLAADARDPLRKLFQLDPSAALPKTGLTSDRIKTILATTGNLDEIIQRSIADPSANCVPIEKQLSRPL
jgi:general L-amino acid transport system substrate-binding protein